jgi:hypothetical protein
MVTRENLKNIRGKKNLKHGENYDKNLVSHISSPLKETKNNTRIK